MVTGMAGSVPADQGPARQLEGKPFPGSDDPVGRHGRRFAIQPVRFRRAVDGPHGGKQFSRVRHVRHPAWMHHQARIRESLHQDSGAASVIEMDMRQKHVVHAGRGQPQNVQRVHDSSARCVTGSVDDDGATLLDDEMDGGQLGAEITGIEGVNAVIVAQQLKHGGSHGGSVDGDSPVTGVA